MWINLLDLHLELIQCNYITDIIISSYRVIMMIGLIMKMTTLPLLIPKMALAVLYVWNHLNEARQSEHFHAAMSSTRSVLILGWRPTEHVHCVNTTLSAKMPQLEGIRGLSLWPHRARHLKAPMIAAQSTRPYQLCEDVTFVMLPFLKLNNISLYVVFQFCICS
jgi:hypothetical protein